MLTFKMIKETETEHKHYRVYLDSEYIGYYLKNNSILAHIDENWNFVSKTDKLPCFYTTTEFKLKEYLNKLINNPLKQFDKSN